MDDDVCVDDFNRSRQSLLLPTTGSSPSRQLRRPSASRMIMLQRKPTSSSSIMMISMLFVASTTVLQPRLVTHGGKPTTTESYRYGVDALVVGPPNTNTSHRLPMMAVMVGHSGYHNHHHHRRHCGHTASTQLYKNTHTNERTTTCHLIRIFHTGYHYQHTKNNT